MAEDIKGELNKTQSRISRRDFLKKGLKIGAIIGAGLIAGGAVINATEISAIENGISTESGTFFPLYETHYKGIDVDKMPENLDVLFKEVAGPGLLVTSTKSIFEANVLFYGNNKAEQKFIQDSVFKKVVTNDMEIMFGDVYFPGILGSRESSYATQISVELRQHDLSRQDKA